MAAMLSDLVKSIRPGRLILAALVAGLLSGGQLVRPDPLRKHLQQAGADPETAAQVGFFEQRLRRDGLDFVAANRLAAAYLQRAREAGDVADLDRAAAALERSLASLPRGNGQAYVQMATVEVARHRFDEALAWASRAERLRPDDPGVQALLSDALLGLGRYAQAARRLEGLAARSPGLGTLARLALMSELEGDRTTAWARLELALTHARAGLPSAESLAWLHVQRGHFLFAGGELAAAEREYRAALEAFPGYVHGLGGLARVRAARGELGRAADLYAAVVDRMPLPQYVVAQVDVLRALGRQAQAERQRQLVWAIDELYRTSGVDTDLEMIVFAADYESDLTGWLERAGALEARRPTIYAADALAWVLYRSGDVAGASQAISRALRPGTRDPQLLFHAAMIAWARGDRIAAGGFLEQVQALNPRFSPRYARELSQLAWQLRWSRP